MRPQDVIKMRSTLKSFVREWSDLGQEERNQSYKPLIDEVVDYFTKEKGIQPYDSKTGERISVLMPGCGLGRLVFEFAKRGFKA